LTLAKPRPTNPISIFFFGAFRAALSGPDLDARIGYCTSKKLAYVGYKCHLICSSDDMTALDFEVTPANVHDSKLFIPLTSNLISRGFLSLVKESFGDNAYNTKVNREFCEEKRIKASFHTKEETGKTPKKKRSARKKSRKRSKIETVFGISHENMGFGSVRVRGLRRVVIDTALIFIGWNFGILYSFYIDRLVDRISLKRLLYKN